jgi:hypothetical protein
MTERLHPNLGKFSREARMNPPKNPARWEIPGLIRGAYQALDPGQLDRPFQPLVKADLRLPPE